MKVFNLHFLRDLIYLPSSVAVKCNGSYLSLNQEQFVASHHTQLAMVTGLCHEEMVLLKQVNNGQKVWAVDFSFRTEQGWVDRVLAWDLEVCTVVSKGHRFSLSFFFTCDLLVTFLRLSCDLRLSCTARMRNDMIENYFNLGLTAPEIALFLVSLHGIGISLRQTQTACRFRKWSKVSWILSSSVLHTVWRWLGDEWLTAHCWC